MSLLEEFRAESTRDTRTFGARASTTARPSTLERCTNRSINRSTCGLALDDLRLQALEVLLLASGAGRSGSPTKVASVCHQMLWGRCGSWTLHSGFEPRRAAERSTLGVVVPRAAAGDVGVLLGVRQDDRALAVGFVGGELLVGVGDRSGPGTIPRRCRECRRGPTGWASSCRPACGFSAFSTYQAYSSIFAGLVAPEIGGLGAGAAGIFPLGLGGQAVDLARSWPRATGNIPWPRDG